MNSKLLGSLSATAFATTLGLGLACTSAIAETNPAELGETTVEEQTLETAAESTGEEEAKATLETPSRNITSIYPHLEGNVPAATLYVHQLPVITFLGEADASEESQKSLYSDVGVVTPAQIREGLLSSVVESEEDPVWRATLAAEKIDRLTGEEAAKITAAWNGERRAYIIQTGEKELFALGDQTIRLNGTKNLESDTLSIVNLLRRLTEGAPPLTLGDISPRRRSTLAYAPSRNWENYAARSVQQGIASWYGGYFHGRRSASGERYNQNALTAAHRSLPFGTHVRVTNLNNGRTVVVRINDRGPFIRGRIIDLSRAAAGSIGMLGSGIAPVKVEVLGR